MSVRAAHPDIRNEIEDLTQRIKILTATEVKEAVLAEPSRLEKLDKKCSLSGLPELEVVYARPASHLNRASFGEFRNSGLRTMILWTANAISDQSKGLSTLRTHQRLIQWLKMTVCWQTGAYQP